VTKIPEPIHDVRCIQSAAVIPWWDTAVMVVVSYISVIPVQRKRYIVLLRMFAKLVGFRKRL
jgi:hypothetical protein